MDKKDRLKNLTPELREAVAENMKERIYSTITLLAVITALWQTSEHHSALGLSASIGGAAIALWAASLIASRMSYRAVHGKSISLNQYRHVLFTSSGLLAPAFLPIVLVTVSATTHMYTLKTALLIAIIATLFSLFLLSFRAGQRIYTSFWRLMLVSLLELFVGIGVVLLKLAVGE